MKTVEKLSENILDKLSIDFLRNQVLKNAYGNNDTVIAGMDPRILLVWYLFFGLVPWFVNDLPFLIGCFLLVAVTTMMAKVAGLVLFLFGLGVFSQTGYLLIVTLLFGGRFRHCAAAGADAEGRHGFPGLHYCFLRDGSGQACQRADVVWMPGAAVLLHFLCLPDAAHPDGGISKYSALLSPAGQSAGA